MSKSQHYNGRRHSNGRRHLYEWLHPSSQLSTLCMKLERMLNHFLNSCEHKHKTLPYRPQCCVYFRFFSLISQLTHNWFLLISCRELPLKSSELSSSFSTIWRILPLPCRCIILLVVQWAKVLSKFLFFDSGFMWWTEWQINMTTCVTQTNACRWVLPSCLRGYRLQAKQAPG